MPRIQKGENMSWPYICTNILEQSYKIFIKIRPLTTSKSTYDQLWLGLRLDNWLLIKYLGRDIIFFTHLNYQSIIINFDIRLHRYRYRYICPPPQKKIKKRKENSYINYKNVVLKMLLHRYRIYLRCTITIK